MNIKYYLCDKQVEIDCYKIILQLNSPIHLTANWRNNFEMYSHKKLSIFKSIASVCHVVSIVVNMYRYLQNVQTV